MMRLRSAGLVMLFVAILLLGGRFVVHAVANPPPSSNPPLRSGCSHLTLDPRQSIIPSFSGRPSTLVYGCGTGSAFTTEQSRGGVSPQATPVFRVPSGWILSVGMAKFSHECTSGGKMITLSSGIPVTLYSGTDYVYCLTATSAISFSTFSITWSR